MLLLPASPSRPRHTCFLPLPRLLAANTAAAGSVVRGVHLFLFPLHSLFMLVGSAVVYLSIFIYLSITSRCFMVFYSYSLFFIIRYLKKSVCIILFFLLFFFLLDVCMINTFLLTILSLLSVSLIYFFFSSSFSLLLLSSSSLLYYSPPHFHYLSFPSCVIIQVGQGKANVCMRARHGTEERGEGVLGPGVAWLMSQDQHVQRAAYTDDG